ncbi:MAG: hypothetical protein EOP85_12790 [Verrucomicrobiaceae bacterium]|nr:MAG: hypothetical protein EOP85_12790 [Verrucomicrobiaceae bacterium]
MKSGKSSDKLQASPLVTILEDLDFIDAIRVGDWNGAKARWEIIRQAKKGYSPGSGNNAGSVKNKATRPELEALLKALVGIFGKTNMPTNFDVELLWHIFPKEHFHPDLLREVKQRLIFWSGIFGVLLLETESKMTGISDLMLSKLRTEVEVFREEFARFLRSIYRSDSFRSGIENMPELDPVWSVKPLYSIDAFTKYCTMLATYGLAAPATLREMCDIDDARESERMLESHSRPKEYTPPFEPRQGIASGFTVPDTGGGSGQDQNLPGEGGRPAETGD